MNKNIIIGVGLVGLGLYLASKAKKQGKVVPFIGRFVGGTTPPPAPKEGASSFSGVSASRSWDY